MLCWECILITDRLKTISGGNYNFKSIHTPRTDQVLDMVRFRSSNSSKDKKKESLQVIIFFFKFEGNRSCKVEYNCVMRTLGTFIVLKIAKLSSIFLTLS